MLAVIASAAPFAATAEAAPPAAFGAPEHFGVSPDHSSGDGLYISLSAPEDIRAYMQKRTADNPDDSTFAPGFQIDCKIDGGSWHYTPEWDLPKTAPGPMSGIYISFAAGESYLGAQRAGLADLFPEDAALKAIGETGWDYYKSRSITFRARFAESFNGETYVLSPWSKEYTLSANKKADWNRLINHAPSLVSAEVKKMGDGEPYFEIKTGRLPGEVQDLNAMTRQGMRTEVWVRRAGDKDFKPVWDNERFVESIHIRASDYFPNKDNYNAESYEIKIRYSLDLREYYQSGHFQTSAVAVSIYSPFSNVISHNMPAWSNASTWASAELKRADDAGLIPDILKGADLTKPITREEFAELAVLLYEKTTGQKATAASPNPFKDTTNPQILKAFKLGITTGTTATTFAPKELINREQVATMLSRALRVMAPGADFSTAGAPALTDRKDISAYAVDHVLFMAKLEIIKGVDGKFMPKATTTAQKASGYATATREQSILMSVRSYEKMDTIKSSKGAATHATQPSQAAQKPATPAAPSSAPKPSAGASAFPVKAAPTENSIVGAWVHVQANITGTLAGTLARHYYVFYPDGKFMWGMPEGGLYGFDFQERIDNDKGTKFLPDYGTYTFKNGKGQLTGNNGTVLEITMDSRYKSLNIGNYKGFLFIPWRDGLRLEGEFTTLSPNLDGIIPKNKIAENPESFLYLNRDGTFEDKKGIFRWQGKNYPTLDEVFPPYTEDYGDVVYPGKGTYELIDHSLIFHYDDGVTAKHGMLLDVIEMGELDYSSGIISPEKIYIRKETPRWNLLHFQ
jgi:hypothetical protein